MEVPSTTISATTFATGSTIFKYIVKEKQKKVIIISDSDDEGGEKEKEQDALPALPPPQPPQPPQSTSSPSSSQQAVNIKKRKRSESQNIHGNVHDPISLDDSEEDEFFDVETNNIIEEESENLLSSETSKLLILASTYLFNESDLNNSKRNTMSPLSEYTTMSDFEVPSIKHESALEVPDVIVSYYYTIFI